MGFIKNFRRDFAQAVNELLPETDEKPAKKKKDLKKEQEVFSQEESTEKGPESREPVAEASVQDAVSEAILREEADRLREEILQNTEERVEQMNREMDEEIDRLPDLAEAAEDREETGESDEEEVTGVAGPAEETGTEASLQADDEEPQDSGETAGDTAGEGLPEAAPDPVEELFADPSESEVPGTTEDSVSPADGGPAEDPEASAEDQIQETEAIPADEGSEERSEAPAEEEASGTEPAQTADEVPETTGTTDGSQTEELYSESEVERLAELEAQAGVDEPLAGLAADCTYITAKTKIKGDIETEGDIDLIGTITGNVTCPGKLIVGGHIFGNVEAGELYANQAKIEGPIHVTDSVKIGVGSVIIGNITGNSAVIAGAVQGDIDIQGPVIVDSSAVIVGNIKSRSVQINNGAIIEGFCSQSYMDVDVKKYFEQESEAKGDTDSKVEELMPENTGDEKAEDVKSEQAGRVSGSGTGGNKNQNRKGKR